MYNKKFDLDLYVLSQGQAINKFQKTLKSLTYKLETWNIDR